MYCTNCGTQIPENVGLCPGCGTTQDPNSNDTTKRATSLSPTASEDPSVGAAAKMTANVAFASQTAGEISFCHALPVAGNLSAAMGPFTVLLQGLSELLRGFGASFKDKKRWVTALALALLWFALTLLPLLGVNPPPFEWLSFLTFAQGGTSGGITGLVGGVVGKGVFAYFVVALVLPLTRGQNPFAGIGTGLKELFPAAAAKSSAQLSQLLAGMGAALILYNFMSGTASLQNSMAGIAALLLSLRALSSKAGFLRRFLGTLTTKLKTKGSLTTGEVNRIIAGMAAGFALGVPLSAISLDTIGYFSGILLIIASGVLRIAVSRTKEEAI